jgi:hypothetical protein
VSSRVVVGGGALGEDQPPSVDRRRIEGGAVVNVSNDARSLFFGI